MVEKLTQKMANWKYGPLIAAFLVVLGVLIIIPESPSPPSSTTSTTTTTVPVTNPPTTVLGQDGEVALANYIKSTPNPVIDRVWTVSKTLDLSGLKDKTITGVGAGEIRRVSEVPDRVAPLINLKGAQNIVLKNLTLTGPAKCVVDTSLNSFGVYALRVPYDPKLEGQAGVWLEDAQNITLENMRITSHHGDGVYIRGASDQVQIKDSTVECSGRGAVTNVGSTNVSIRGGSFSGSGQWTFNIEPDLTATVSNYTIENVDVGYSVNWWLFSDGPAYSCRVTGVRVSKVRITNQIWEWLTSKKCSTPPDIQVSDCTPPSVDRRGVCKKYSG